MRRRRFLTLAASVPFSLAAGKYSLLQKKKAPNFVFFLIDDLGWKDTGFMGSQYYETPHLDRLAAQGMSFSNAYANGPNCAPSRASMLTGQYTPRHGVYTVGSPERGEEHRRKLIPIQNKTELDPEKITLAEMLKKAGYVSASIGKWHLGGNPRFGPMAQGFDVNIAGNHTGHPPSYFSPYQNPDLADGPPGEHLPERLTQEALRFIERHHKISPFFLYLPYYSVHTPLQAKAEIIKKYQRKLGNKGQDNPVYAAMIAAVDQGVGKILTKLDALGIADNTVVIFFSDNGGLRRVTSQEPLRGGKGMLYEGGIRVPLSIRWPGRIKPGTICAAPVMGMDIFPTLCEISGVGNPAHQVIDGHSLLPLFSGQGSLDRRELFWHFPAYLEGKAEGARDPYFRTSPAGAVRQGDWKLIEYFEDSALELYNLKKDPGEKENLISQMPQRTQELHAVLSSWRRSLQAPVPTQLNPKYNPGLNPDPRKRI